MEKLIYALWDADSDRLRRDLPSALAQAEAKHLRINVQDEMVAPGADLIQSRGEPLANAIIQFWLPSSNVIFRNAADEAIASHCDSFHAWLVAESTIIANEKHPPKPGERTAGFAQMAFLTKPAKLDWQSWRAVWRDYHTQVAIDTQSNFEYVQNLVIEPLTDGAPPYVAIVEECFPIEALTDPLVFFDARQKDGDADQGKFERNLATMMESVDRFIDQGTIDVFPTSQYNLD